MKIQKSFKFLALILVAAFFSIQGVNAQSIEQVSPIKAKLMARNGAVMIDVREVAELAVLAYDVDGIINIPMTEIEDRIKEIPKDKKIVIACRSGNRSMKAATFLASNGYTNIYNLEGGIKGWQAKKLEVIVDGKKSAKSCCSSSAKSSCGDKKAKSSCSDKKAKSSCGEKAKKEGCNH